jgi:hypothetical protein
VRLEGRGKSRRSLFLATFVAGLVAGFLVVACGPAKKPVVAPAPVATVSNKCPDHNKADDLAAFDYAKEYNLSRDAADKLKAATLTAMEVTTLAEKLDADLGIACAAIAHDLGNKGDWRAGNEACTAAIKAVHDARAKLGGRAQTQLVVRTPICVVDATIMTKCASICDSSVAASKVKAECEQKTGRCDGNCDGTCEGKGAIKCDGTCSGSCDSVVRGTCGGRCRGKCDNKKIDGTCSGFCEGTCEKGAMTGECKGQCTGSCKLTKASICEGTCSGTCTVELSELKCAGEFKPPDVSTDCRARCELEVMNKRECSTPQVGYIVTGLKEKEYADLKAAIDKSFPGLLKILLEVGEKGPKRVLNAQAIIESARTGFKDMARSNGKATAAQGEAQLVKCFDDPFKKAEAAATAIKTMLDQAIAVRDEAK